MSMAFTSQKTTRSASLDELLNDLGTDHSPISVKDTESTDKLIRIANEQTARQAGVIP